MTLLEESIAERDRLQEAGSRDRDTVPEHITRLAELNKLIDRLQCDAAERAAT